MKITKLKLKQIIKEEIEEFLSEGKYGYGSLDFDPRRDFEIRDRYSRQRARQQSSAPVTPDQKREANWEYYLQNYAEREPETLTPQEIENIKEKGTQGWPPP
tara:strand:- start:258 stop:563 length:306 start_codon:yes stop_codon:yes gene_type:complete